MKREPLIQIAGVIDQAEADMLVNSGAKYIGFPLRLPVHKEDLSEEDAAKIIQGFPEDVNGILITYLDKANDIIELSEKIGTSFVQIHGDIQYNELNNLRVKRPSWYLIKSLVVGEKNIEELKNILENFSELVDSFIIDTYDSSTGASGATGKTHDWSISRQIVSLSSKPIILAGGLNDVNVTNAIEYVSPAGVDAHTGVEDENGRKDPSKIRKFISQAKIALSKRTIVTPNSLNVRILEQLMFAANRAANGNITELIIDLKQTQFIEVVALMYLLAIIEKRNALSYKTQLLLPRKKSVRDFLRLWRFPQAVFECTGRNFSEYCTKEDIYNYFSENKSDDDYIYKAYSKVVDQMINDRFFAISTHTVSDRSENTFILANESARWKNPLIQGFLKIALQGESGSSYVSSRIVYEAMTNALRHPSATLVASTSFCDEKPKDKVLTIVFWDNGRPMQETLRAALASGHKVRADIDNESHFVFDVKHYALDGKISSSEIKTDSDLQNLKSDYEFFLACLFPGVSRDLSRNHYYPSSDDSYNQPGWGLVALLNCVCEIFNGSASFRSGRIYAKVVKCENSNNTRFSVSITEYDDDASNFNGNLVSIRLPIRRAKL